MRKIISSINITLDGFCDHTAAVVDDELHLSVNEFMAGADTLLFGRKTYQLMEDAFPAMVKNPTGNKPIDDFAVLMENMEKVVFSNTLKSVNWNNARLATGSIQEEVAELQKQPGRNIGVGGPTLIIEMMNLDLIDEYQFYIHPIILGSGLPLFKNISKKVDLRLLKTKALGTGVVVVYYERIKGGR